MARRFVPHLVGVAVLVAATVVVTTEVPAGAAEPVPSSMAALGDSITRGFDACGWWVDCPVRSWSTGEDSAVNSQYLRIRALNPAIAGHAFNDAKTGAVVADLAGQVQTAVSQHVDYVTILMGANDACTSSESTMTPVATFTDRFRSALASLFSGLPNARVEVVSIPDIKRLWSVGKTNAAALTVWDVADICQSMLANPTSTAAADNDRRDRVRQRVIDYNTALADTCGQYANCRFDGLAAFSYQFTLNQISGWDYFHPNTAGQATLADITYKAGFAW